MVKNLVLLAAGMVVGVTLRRRDVVTAEGRQSANVDSTRELNSEQHRLQADLHVAGESVGYRTSVLCFGGSRLE